VTRSILTICFGIVLATLVVPAAAWADDPAPTPAQLEESQAGVPRRQEAARHGQAPEAIEKFKESYNLSKNPVLLYNIAVTMEEAGSDDLALIYYRKFLAERAGRRRAASRGQRSRRRDRQEADRRYHGRFRTPSPIPSEAGSQRAQGAAQDQAAGTYGPNDFQHVAIETRRRPSRSTSRVCSRDSGFTVTLYFRTAGEGKFTAKVMKWRYKELVARIPAPKMIGNASSTTSRSRTRPATSSPAPGKSTSPNLVTSRPARRSGSIRSHRRG